MKVIAENPSTGERKLTATSFVTFVSVDDHGKPMPVPGVIPETAEEKYLNETAKERRQERLKKRESLTQFLDKLDLPR